jgi:hypothetical protein
LFSALNAGNYSDYVCVRSDRILAESVIQMYEYFNMLLVAELHNKE